MPHPESAPGSHIAARTPEDPATAAAGGLRGGYPAPEMLDPSTNPMWNNPNESQNGYLGLGDTDKSYRYVGDNRPHEVAGKPIEPRYVDKIGEKLAPRAAGSYQPEELGKMPEGIFGKFGVIAGLNRFLKGRAAKSARNPRTHGGGPLDRSNG
ncbi:MAG TPA: hypothetical protein VD735_03805 [Candidatus Saccharimonadales bacterium]|nr:hypothetical protein [Candidatus Saccharimonadales bacterium]